jgi:hypothetical protein
MAATDDSSIFADDRALTKTLTVTLLETTVTA